MERLWKATGNRNKVLELFQIGNENDDAQPRHLAGAYEVGTPGPRS